MGGERRESLASSPPTPTNRTLRVTLFRRPASRFSLRAPIGHSTCACPPTRPLDSISGSRRTLVSEVLVLVVTKCTHAFRRVWLTSNVHLDDVLDAFEFWHIHGATTCSMPRVWLVGVALKPSQPLLAGLAMLQRFDKVNNVSPLLRGAGGDNVM
jgi:hypothetical protein